MSDRGYDLARLGLDEIDPGQLYIWLDHQFPADPADVPWPGEPGNARWRAAVGVERAVARADAACRADAYWAGIRMLGPSLDRFVATYRGQLAELDAQYAALHRRVLADTAREERSSGSSG